jgi:hypothetical protein
MPIDEGWLHLASILALMSRRLLAGLMVGVTKPPRSVSVGRRGRRQQRSDVNGVTTTPRRTPALSRIVTSRIGPIRCRVGMLEQSSRLGGSTPAGSDCNRSPGGMSLTNDSRVVVDAPGKSAGVEGRVWLRCRSCR